MAVRTACGLFDVSHMGEILLEGPDALKNIQNLVTNDCAGMADGQARYSPMCNEAGGVLDDLLVYRLSGERYLLVVNASNREKDYDWMASHRFGDVVLADRSDGTAQLALQGPNAVSLMAELFPADTLPKKYYSFVPELELDGIRCLVSRTGYTGEAGFELYCAAGDAPALWEKLLSAGEKYGLVPCGLGARDTLRLEAAMPLYGHEMDETVTPLEAGLGMFVKLQKDNFIGKEALLKHQVPACVRAGLRMTGRGIAREKCAVYQGQSRVGMTTSGTFCPYLNAAVAMALLEPGASKEGTALSVDIRGRRVEAEIVPLPFYRRAK
jgi:aminomethyltransferase